MAQDGDTGGEETEFESEASLEEEEEEEDGGLEADSADESVYSESVLSLGGEQNTVLYILLLSLLACWSRTRAHFNM